MTPRKGLTQKPCEGCRQVRFREIGRVCAECQALLREAKAARDAQATTAADQGLLVRYPPSYDHYLRSYYHQAYSSIGAMGAARERVSNAVARLARVIGRPALGRAYYGPQLFQGRDPETGALIQEYEGSAKMCLYTQAEIDALIELDTALRLWPSYVYAHGYKQGSDLLNQMAQGKITTDMFDAEIKRTHRE